MSSYKGGVGISTARRVLRESHTMSTRQSIDGLSPHPSATREHTADVEAPLLEQPSAEAAAAAVLQAAARAAEAEAQPNGQRGATAGEGQPAALEPRPSLTHPAYQENRDSRSLWRLARRNVGARRAAGRPAGRRPAAALRCR